VSAEDVADAPTVTLLAAMRLAAGRDRIAAQYAQGFEDLFVNGLSSLPSRVMAKEPFGPAAVQAVYLGFLGRCSDSHIVRKFGAATAQAVTDEARPWLERVLAGQDVDGDPAFVAWDESLKQRGLNPGTSADLTVATLFLAGALDRTA
jgi:triphosphoribosyl-dephospho-CoA synthase